MTANGGDTETVLPEHRQRMVDAANSAYQKALNDIDGLEQRLREALIRIDGQQVQLEAMQGIHNMMESSIASHRIERDQAVARAAKLEAVIENVFIVVNSALKKTEPL